MGHDAVALLPKILMTLFFSLSFLFCFSVFSVRLFICLFFFWLLQQKTLLNIGKL